MPIELATLADLDRLVELWAALAEEQRQYESHLTVEPNQDLMREAVAQHVVDHTCLVLRREVAGCSESTGILGFITFDRERDGLDRDVDRGVVENLYVVPTARGNGHGTALLDAAEEALSGTGAERIVLEAMAANEDARQFYEATGYRPHRVTYERSVADGKDT